MSSISSTVWPTGGCASCWTGSSGESSPPLELDRLYITRGEVEGTLKVMDTSLGKLSVTLDHGDIAVKTASNVNALLEQV